MHNNKVLRREGCEFDRGQGGNPDMGVGRKVKREGNDVITYLLPKKNKYKCLRQELLSFVAFCTLYPLPDFSVHHPLKAADNGPIHTATRWQPCGLRRCFVLWADVDPICKCPSLSSLTATSATTLYLAGSHLLFLEPDEELGLHSCTCETASYHFRRWEVMVTNEIDTFEIIWDTFINVLNMSLVVIMSWKWGYTLCMQDILSCLWCSVVLLNETRRRKPKKLSQFHTS